MLRFSGKLAQRRSLPPEARVEMLGVWTEANLNCKLNDVSLKDLRKEIISVVICYTRFISLAIDGAETKFSFQVVNEGILDSILPYLVGYKKPAKTTSVYTPIIKKVSSGAGVDIKKPASFEG